jgi:amidophosphoribosyltransferase
MCGILGVFNHAKAAEQTALGLFAEQHRGQESCGMAVSDGKVIRLRKRMGLVKEVFPPSVLADMPGRVAIGHVRYPTCGAANEFNSQPHVAEPFVGTPFALASNGDIVNYAEVRARLEADGVNFNSSNDGELLLKYLVYHIVKLEESVEDAIRNLMRDIKGAYSTVLMTRDTLHVFRDPHGIRPLVWGETADGSVVAASESCALDILRPIRKEELPPATILRIDEHGVQRFDADPAPFRDADAPRHCVFEHIYFSRPDNVAFGEDVYQVRQRIGAALAHADEDLVPDAVVPVPDSSNFIALGYAKAKNAPFEMGLIRNHYVGRTFIKPQQTIRDESARQKFNPLPNFFRGKKIVLVDDSIVRGTTIGKIVHLIFEQGAREVHLRIGSPPVRYSCFYGIDTPTRSELAANTYTIPELEKHLGVTSLRHLDTDALRGCVEKPGDYCYACFNGDYPIPPRSEKCPI